MEQTLQLLNDKKWVRWTALCLLASAMFFGYIFMDVLSPLQTALQTTKGWNPSAYGHFAGSETFLNVFVFFLIFAGIILDKMGVRFTAILSGAVMFAGAAINYLALTEWFDASSLKPFMEQFLNLPEAWWNITPFYVGMPASAKMSAIGFMIFGCGVEMAGITVSRGIVKWFAGKEMALAMGIEMAIARIGVAVVFVGSPAIAAIGGSMEVSRPLGLAVLLLLIGLICFIVYSFMDRKLDAQIGKSDEAAADDEQFRISDLRYIFSSKVFWIVALLCVLYYSAIFPFQKYANNMLQCNLGITAEQAGLVFSVFPLGAAAITPMLGNFLDRRGKGATMLIYGAILMIVCHLTFAFGLPALRGADTPETIGNETIITGHAVGMTSAGTPFEADVVFSPKHFSSESQMQLFYGHKTGDEVVFNPSIAYADPEDAGKTAERVANLLNLDYADALECNGDFRLNIEKIEAPSGFAGIIVAFLAIIVLGISFSLVPASLWPSVPKLVDVKLLGSAYAVIFWIQNIGLYAFPMIIGSVLVKANPGINNPLSYNYTWPMVLFACLGGLALMFGLWLKAIDRKRGYGLEKPNITVPKAEEEYPVD